MSDTLENVKVGDTVILSSGGFTTQWDKVTVEKVGKLHITVRGIKFKKNGHRAGSDNYRGLYIRQFVETEWNEYQAERKLKRTRALLADFDWRNCPGELAYRIYDLLPKAAGAEQGGQP